MKTITLNVPDSFELSDRFKEENPENIAEILYIGEYLYYNGKRLKDELDVKEKCALQVSISDAQVEQTIKMAQLQIEREKESIRSIFARMIDEKELENASLKRRIEHLEIENSQSLLLGQKLDSLMGKGNAVDNMAKGDFGEAIIEHQLIQWWPESIVEDRSGEAQAGDRLWTFGDLRALVESKNVQAVRYSEIQKFERDVSVNIENGQCNAAIFCSLKTESIPGKGKFKLEFFKGAPIVYISQTMEDLNFMRFGFEVLINVQKMSKLEESETNENDLAFKQRIIQFVSEIFQKFTTMNQNVQTLKNVAMSEEKHLNELIRSVTLLRNEYDFLKEVKVEPAKPTGIKKEQLVQELVEFKKNNSRWPTVAEISAPNWMLRGELSLRKIKEEAEKLVK
jgi:regulator of replication initiation timing